MRELFAFLQRATGPVYVILDGGLIMETLASLIRCESRRRTRTSDPPHELPAGPAAREHSLEGPLPVYHEGQCDLGALIVLSECRDCDF